MRLLLDMNVSPRLAGELQNAGIDAIHWIDLGDATASDQSISKRAIELDAVIVTHDLDFGALIAQAGTRRPSVIQIRADDLSVPILTVRILQICRGLESELVTGALVTLDLFNVRVRTLPIHQ